MKQREQSKRDEFLGIQRTKLVTAMTVSAATPNKTS